MSRAYQRSEPHGLSEYHDFTRWRVLEGSTDWQPYHRKHLDTLCLDALYYLAAKQEATAESIFFDKVVPLSGAIYEEDSQQFVYPSVRDTYHLGLMAIVAAQLMHSTTPAVSIPALQHYLALRSALLSLQQYDPQQRPIGWLSNTKNTATLINTESIAVSVLGLGAAALETYEFGLAPLSYNQSDKFFYRPYHVLSAVVSLSTPQSYLSQGPSRVYHTGKYNAEFMLRVPSNTGTNVTVATLTVYGATTHAVLAERQVLGSDMSPENQWTRVVMPFATESATGAVEFRTLWVGQVNLDASIVRVVPV
eukprot:TRINITY_DN3371_c0_g1_i12.p1 TRINITY_DN3371_c0_g1~~TRINITY_DN3371_c0_g1_i12.p1  ORF type:complete len:307 (-),score=71.95 TRINITY_DN3371_c0_g1_i12:123-1043(-)